MSNRHRITVVVGDGWRDHHRAPLPGWAMLGIVQRGLDVGALARSRTGELVMLRGGVALSLDQRKAHHALQAAQNNEVQATAHTKRD